MRRGVPAFLYLYFDHSQSPQANALECARLCCFICYLIFFLFTVLNLIALSRSSTSQISCFAGEHPVESGLVRIPTTFSRRHCSPLYWFVQCSHWQTVRQNVTCQSCCYATISGDDLISNTYKYYHQQ